MNADSEAFMMDQGRRPVVYIVEQQPFDYSPAHVFGDIKFMEAPRIAPDAPGGTWNDNLIHGVRRQLLEYTPGFDYVIPTGSPSRIALVGMILREKGHVHLVLGWDAKSQRYLKYSFNLNKMMGDLRDEV